MNTFSLVQNALNKSADDVTKEGLSDEVIETGRILTAVQTVVDALTPPDGGRYVVGFSDISTAQTQLGARRITVSSKPIHDPKLSLVEKAVVLATFAAHEIGHTLVTRPRGAVVREHNPKSGFHAVANLADDIILEPFMVERFPILADAFTFTGMWVLRSTSEHLPKEHRRLDPEMTTPERFNLLLSATRYGDIDEIRWPDAWGRAERDWSRLWADRLIETRLSDHGAFIALCDEAWVRIRSIIDDGDVPPPVITEPGGEPGEPGGEPGEPGGEPGQPGEPGEGGFEPEPGDGDGDEDGDGEPEDGESDEDGDGDGDGAGDGEPDVNEQDRDWDDGSGDPTPGEGESKDGQPDGDASDREDGKQTDAPDDASGGGGAADALRDEDDFDKNKVDESTHDQAERDPWDSQASRDEEQARTYSNTDVTAFGQHGKMTTTWS